VSTFFGNGIAAHVAFAHPFCRVLQPILAESVEAAGARAHRGGTYVCMEGPQFSTLAESMLYRSWGMDVIGMTNLQEAKLAREAEICYVTMALVTDYDCATSDHDHVTVESSSRTSSRTRRRRSRPSPTRSGAFPTSAPANAPTR
jgi:5'-methylthioadenosine phosphorylase